MLEVLEYNHNCTARPCSQLRRNFMEYSIISPYLSLWMKPLDISQHQKAPNFSAFHWSPQGSLVSIGQHFLTTSMVHLSKRLVGWLLWVLQPFETVFQSISGRLPERGRKRGERIEMSKQPHSHPLQSQLALALLSFKLQDAPALEVYPGPSHHPTTPYRKGPKQA